MIIIVKSHHEMGNHVEKELFYFINIREEIRMNNKRTGDWKKVLAVSVLAAMLPGGVLMAENATAPVYTLDAVVVTATRTENDIKNVPASTQVITENDIKRSGATNVRDAITDYANITMTRKIRGGGHEIIVRGMSTDKSLIMVNGHRVANEADGTGLGNANALDRINVDSIEKIEIVKGPSSALYGSEAMGGVINIITKGSKEAEVRTGLVNTSEDFTNWWHLDSGEIGKFSATMDLRFSRDKTHRDENSSWNNYHGTAQTYNFDAKYRFNDHNYLNFYVDAFSQNQVREGDGREFVTVPAMMAQGIWTRMLHQKGKAPTIQGYKITNGNGAAHYNQKTYGLNWNGRTNRNEWQIQTYFSKFKWSNNTTTAVSSVPVTPGRYTGMILGMYNGKGGYEFNTNSNKLWAIEGRDSMRIDEHHRLTFGAEYTKNKVYGTNLGDAAENVGTITKNGVTNKVSDKEINTYAGYLQDEITLGKWFIVPAVRYDHHSMFGSHTSPKLGVTYKADDSFRIKANYGKGFKAPTIPQLYYHFSMAMGGPSNVVTLLGNPNLKPETSNSWDIGFEKEWDRVNTTLTYFHTTADNLIQYRKIPTEKNTSRSENIEKAKFSGLEHTLGVKITNRWNFKVNSTWLFEAKQHGENTAWRDLEQRSRLSQVYSLSYDDGKDIGWSALLWDELNYKYATPVSGTSSLTAGPRKSFNTLNFTLTRKVNADTRIYGSVQNIFDKVDTDCYLGGRFWALGWEHKF
jgi:outer membrane receptor for ferrienterochelin and colicins